MARRLDQRDREILRALFDHQVLLTYQIKVLFFSSLRRCQEVLRELREIGLIDRDLPTERIGVGKAQGHWTITEAGVQVVAVTMRKPRSQLDWMPRDSWHESDRHREHLLGVNRFFVSLVEASLRFPDHGLERWTPEQEIQSKNNWIRHDGLGRYHHPGGTCDIYLEYDRGTEWHDQLVSKLRGYLLTYERWTKGGWEELDKVPNLIVVVPSEKRERAWDRALENALDRFDLNDSTAVRLPMFVTSEELLKERGVLGRIWRRFVPVPKDRPLAARFLADRLSLVELPANKAGPYDLDRCLGRRWTDDGARSKLRALPQPPTFPAGDPPAGSSAVEPDE
jgi:hypothetical protein